MDNVDIRLLRVFLALMTELNVTRAADAIGVGQPALSQSLARLRTLFGDPLLVRSRGTMVPTDRARELEQSVRLMLAEYDRMLAGSDAFEPRTSRRRFVVTIPDYAEYVLMPELLRRLRHEAPAIRVEARAPDPDRAIEQLESGDVDLRIAWLLSPPARLRSEHLFDDRIVCLASRSHPRIDGELSLEQFLELPHVQPLGTGRSTSVRVIDEALGRTLERTFLVQNLLTIPLIVSATDMLATLPGLIARAFAAQHDLQLLELPMRLPQIRYAAYWHERRETDAGHQWFRELLRDVARTSSALRC